MRAGGARQPCPAAAGSRCLRPAPQRLQQLLRTPYIAMLCGFYTFHFLTRFHLLLPPLAEAEQGARHHTDTAQFLQAATKDVYGTTKGGSLEDTVGRRAFFNDRSGAAGYKK